jgi:hypothetical protein
VPVNDTIASHAARTSASSTLRQEQQWPRSRGVRPGGRGGIVPPSVAGLARSSNRRGWGYGPVTVGPVTLPLTARGAGDETINPKES